MMKRMCWWGRIKPDKIEEYKESHRVVWPELLAVYKKHGIVKISCFLKGNDLLVYTEYDPEIYLKGGKEAIGKTEVSQRWSTWMLEFALPGFTAVEFEEVFRME
jgi:L-rhamnose mutarotase